ncbi:amino acid ABC transporter permease [Sinorhizobium americanum]|uniref:Polar amino acid transport system permease protein n=1 Tax=Sinorhizobium americanum TaxID=194963 RepID=A0A4R2BB86_9HYPH|nr:amino acid ABC transporter permease [Sinorhizobium americanum]TCN22789.1 polar amino acid transport system permease protein [Sinorhizobium americanum]
MGYQFDFGVVWEAWPILLDGTLTALYYTAVSSALALVFGVIIMVARRNELPPLRYTAKAFIEIIRNTPFIVQLFFIYFGLPSLGLKLSVSAAAITALTVNTAAYIAEVLRGGVDGLPHGQIEAGRALGLNRRQIFFDIVLVPSIRSVYPGLCSQFVLLMLTSSVVASISAPELTYAGQMIEAESFRSFEVYFVVTGIYLVLSVCISTLLRLLGRVFFSYPTK